MILILYNIIQLLALLLLWPVVVGVVLLVPKYRGRFAKRLGYGLKKIKLPEGRRRVWVHALSVGESSSAKPLIEALKQRYPHIFIIFSTTTRGGEQVADSMADLIDVRVPFPVDLLFVVKKFIRYLRPNLFVLVETDFWPNVLAQLQKYNVPTVLVNGRITEESFQGYTKGRALFRSLFDSFHTLLMQTDRDAANMVALGVDASKVHNVGNLKYEMNIIADDGGLGSKTFKDELHIPAKSRVLIAGSTHPGEEAKIARVFKRLQQDFSDLFLIIAPRNVSRGQELLELTRQTDLVSWRRTGEMREGASVLILDTLGELTRAYSLAEVVFVGGSLVDEGGHNPLEASFFGKPVVFGESMTDFLEIAMDIQEMQAGKMVRDEEELHSTLKNILSDDALRKSMGEHGVALFGKQKGAAKRAAEFIGQVVVL